jgi:hypothetical protein
MSLDTLQKPTFSDIFQLFSHGFLRVFRRPFSEVREMGANYATKALVLSAVPSRTRSLRFPTVYHSSPIQGGGQPRPRADNGE